MNWKIKKKHKKLLKKAGFGVLKGSKTVFNNLADIGEQLKKETKPKKINKNMSLNEELNSLFGRY